MTPNPDAPAFRAAELGAILARHYPAAPISKIAHTVALMQSAARAAKSWEERRCNYPMTESQDYRGRQTVQRTQDIINAILTRPDLLPDSDYTGTPVWEGSARVSLGGDCRGSCGHLVIPGHRGDGWGDGYAIY